MEEAGASMSTSGEAVGWILEYLLSRPPEGGFGLGPGRVLGVFAYLPSDWSMRAWKSWPISSAPRSSRAASCAAALVRLGARR